jgi:hypothetical protein
MTTLAVDLLARVQTDYSTGEDFRVPIIISRIKNWIASAVLFTFVLMAFVVVLYLMLMSNMAGYDDYRTCNPETGITRIEWFLGVRPTENDCWPANQHPPG